jgi:hypothetical protein
MFITIAYTANSRRLFEYLWVSIKNYKILCESNYFLVRYET